ncbi:MAG TPA: hypothetical protein VFW12_01345 [Candidatus Limnocylindria bacterium]|nr:hypothetical protein [Candidatus Limnocylindria bacterium]
MTPGSVDLAFVLIALIAAAAILLLVSSRRGTRGSPSELALGAFVVAGAILFPQAATVVLLAFIYRELRKNGPPA